MPPNENSFFSTRQQTLHELLGRLWQHIGPRRRRQLTLLVLLMVGASFGEVLSIGAALPFLAALTAPERVFEHPLAQPVIAWFGFTTSSQLPLPLTIIFGLAVVVAGGLRLLVLWANIRISFAIGADLSVSVYRRTLYQPYSIHVARNSSEIISGTNKAERIIYTTILPVLNIITSSVLLLIVVLALLAIDFVITLAAVASFALMYALIVHITKQRLAANSRTIASESTHVLKAAQEGLGGIRDVLIDGTQEVYCGIYRRAKLRLNGAYSNSSFVGQSPRFGIEAGGLLLIALLAFLLSQSNGSIAASLPVLGAMALGAQRVLPGLQQAYANWSAMRAGQHSLQDVLDLLDQRLPDDAGRPLIEPLPFCEHIRLRHLSFRYAPESPWVLTDLDLTIPRGGRIGLVGTTGSGKSTLLDVVMGLLQPTEGTIQIDGQPLTIANRRAWQARLAHVPQTIYVADTTIAENIAFGVPQDQIDQERVREAARHAQIAETIESWSMQYQTVVGERGIRLSGGERQRIGIARALYKQADVLVFDEATSALDDATERSVMQSIEHLGKDLTVVMVAHRVTTLKNCTQVIELADGRIRRSGSYQEIAGAAA